MLAVRNHIRTCPECEARLEDIRQFKVLMARLSPVKPPASFEQQLLSALHRAEAPFSVKVKNWVIDHFGFRLEPALSAVGVCAALFAVSLGRLPQAIPWADNLPWTTRPAVVTTNTASSQNGYLMDVSAGSMGTGIKQAAPIWRQPSRNQVFLAPISLANYGSYDNR